MIKLSFYIKQLLHCQQVVYVPNLGLFRKEHIPASMQDNSLLPGRIRYSLEHLPSSKDDDRLAAAIAQIEHTSIAISRQKIEEEVQSLLLKINKDGQTVLDQLGYLTYENERLTLEAFDRNFHPLPAVSLNAESNIAVDKTLSQQDNVETITPVPPIRETPIKNSRSPVRKSAVGWLIAATMLILVIGLGYYLWTTERRSLPASALKAQQNDTADEPHMATQQLKNTVHADTGLNASATGAAIQDSLSKLTVASNSLPIESADEGVLVKKVSKDLPFNIIIGSLPTIELAYKEVNNYKAKGIDAFILESNMPGNRKKISYGAYPSWQAAQYDLKKVKREVNAEAYIFPNSETLKNSRIKRKVSTNPSD